MKYWSKICSNHSEEYRSLNTYRDDVRVSDSKFTPPQILTPFPRKV